MCVQNNSEATWSPGCSGDWLSWALCRVDGAGSCPDQQVLCSSPSPQSQQYNVISLQMHTNLQNYELCPGIWVSVNSTIGFLNLLGWFSSMRKCCVLPRFTGSKQVEQVSSNTTRAVVCFLLSSRAKLPFRGGGGGGIGQERPQLTWDF